MNTRSLHFTSPGIRPQILAIAPEAQNPESKRTHLIEDKDRHLNKNLVELDIGTKARNRAFQNRLDEVWRNTQIWEAKLRTEAREAEESITVMKDEYQKHMDDFAKSLFEELHQAFDHIDNDLYPPKIAHLKEMEKNLDIFVDKTVPESIEKQSGEVSRRLKKQYEYFDIEKQKEMKREKKFVTKANEHIQATAQKFNDEAAMMAACFFTLEDDIVEIERRAARMHNRCWDIAVKDSIELRAAIKKEEDIRKVEDADLLDTVIDTQKLLQQTVLQHFGSSEGDDHVEIRFEKLENRMSRRNSKAASISSR